MNYVYLVKNLSPWMINELQAFSRFVSFRLIILRNVNEMYKNDLAFLEKSGVEIFIKPFSKLPSIRKIVFMLFFIIRHAHCFLGVKNIVFGFKSIWWFIFMEDSLIIPASSIHAQFATQASIIALMYKDYLGNVSYTFTFHAHDIYYKNRWFENLVNNSKVAFSISKFSANYVYKKYKKLNKNKIALSRLGTFLPISKKIDEKKSDKELIIGFMGSFVKEKNLLFLLNTIKILISKNNKINIRLILAGEGPLKNTLINFVRKNKLDSIIKFIGNVWAEKKEQFFNEIDIFVLPSKSEGLPVVLMEAISYSIPIISTNISGIPEICIDNYNGFLIPSGDHDALLTAIIKFYNMDENRFQVFKYNAHESSKNYDIIQNSKIKLKKMGWNF